MPDSSWQINPPSPPKAEDDVKVDEQLRGIAYAKASHRRLKSSRSQEFYPDYPKVHDLAYLNLQKQTEKSIKAADEFFVHAKASGWITRQTRYGGNADADGGEPPRADQRMTRRCEDVTHQLEEVTGLNNGILAGQYAKPKGKARLEVPRTVPWTARPDLTDIPDISSGYQKHRPTLLNPAYIPGLSGLPDRVHGDDDEDGIPTELNAESERFRVKLRLDHGPMPEKTPSLRERTGGRPTLVESEWEPLANVAWGPVEPEGRVPPAPAPAPLPSLRRIRTMDEMNASGMSDVRLPGVLADYGPGPAIIIRGGRGTYESGQEHHRARGNHGESSGYHGVGQKHVTTSREHRHGTHSHRRGVTPLVGQASLPSLRQVFVDDDFMKPGFTGSAQQRVPPSTTRDFDLHTIEESRRRLHPHMTKTLKQSDYRVASFHEFEKDEEDEDDDGAADFGLAGSSSSAGFRDMVVSEYFRDRSRTFDPTEYWAVWGDVRAEVAADAAAAAAANGNGNGSGNGNGNESRDGDDKEGHGKGMGSGSNGNNGDEDEAAADDDSTRGVRGARTSASGLRPSLGSGLAFPTPARSNAESGAAGVGVGIGDRRGHAEYSGLFRQSVNANEYLYAGDAETGYDGDNDDDDENDVFYDIEPEDDDDGDKENRIPWGTY